MGLSPVTLNTAIIDEELVASISRILTKNGVPCVLWGNYLLTIYGVPSIVDSIDFVVPDTLVAKATSALQPTGLLSCAEPKTCTAVAERRVSPIPISHFHIDSDFTVSLYGQSSTLWFLPPLAESVNTKSYIGDIILASDPRLPLKRPGRGHGAFRDATLPVYIPAAHRLLESFIRSIAKARRGINEGFFLSMVTYIEEYVDGDGLLDERSLERRCRDFYQGYKSCRKPTIVLLDELEAAFTVTATTNL
jgi:hypothetical protein